MRHLLFISLAIGTAGSTLFAQDQPDTVQLQVSPAGRPANLLAYRLIPFPRDLKPGNAATLHYRAAILCIEPDRAVQQDPENRYADARAGRDGNWLTGPFAAASIPAIHNALQHWQEPIHEVKIAATRRESVWDIPVAETGMSTLLPEMHHFRTLARLLALEARLAIAENRYDDAAASLRAGLQMSRHVGQARTFICSLVAFACESIILDVCHDWMSQPGSPNLYWELTAIPSPLVDVAAGLEGEIIGIEGSIRYAEILETSILSEEQARELTQSLRQLCDLTSNGPFVSTPFGNLPTSSSVAHLLPALAVYPQTKRALIAAGRSPEDVERMPVAQAVTLTWLHMYRQRIEEAKLWSQRPLAESRQAIAQAENTSTQADKSGTDLLPQLFAPSLSGLWKTTARVERKVALLRTIEAIRLHADANNGDWPGSLDEIKLVPVPKDPATGEPFRYEKTDVGIRLAPSQPNVTSPDITYEITRRP
jgi:hypothetical protein